MTQEQRMLDEVTAQICFCHRSEPDSGAVYASESYRGQRTCRTNNRGVCYKLHDASNQRLGAHAIAKSKIRTEPQRVKDRTVGCFPAQGEKKVEDKVRHSKCRARIEGEGVTRRDGLSCRTLRACCLKRGLAIQTSCVVDMGGCWP